MENPIKLPKRLEDVAWFPNAEPEQIPDKAYVQRVHGDCSLDLFVYRVSKELKNVRHINDPQCKVTTKSSRGLGAWDLIETVHRLDKKRENAAIQRREMEAQQRKEHAERVRQKNEQIAADAVELASKKLSNTEIVQALRKTHGPTVTIQHVTQALREKGMVAAR